MSVRQILNDFLTIDNTYLTNSSIKFERGPASYTLKVNDDGNIALYGGSSNINILKCSQTDLLSDCLISQIIEERHTRNLLLIQQQRTEINELKAYVVKLKQFMKAFKESLFIESEAGSLAEYDYSGLI
jgi:hypothetical protein